MSEEPLAEGVLKEQEPEPTIEDIEALFTDLFNQMSAAQKRMTVLGKRIREASLRDADSESQPDIQALVQAYLYLPVSTRPPWFQYLAEQADTKKFAPATDPKQSTPQNGYTQ